MTNQEKLEAFVPYLPYNVKAICSGGVVKVVGIHNIQGGWNFHDNLDRINLSCVIESGYKPILHPLSDLYKPCLEGGKVPLLELAKMAAQQNFTDEWYFEDGFAHTTERLRFVFSPGYFSLRDVVAGDIYCNQLQLFQQLYKWHFWLGDQSEFGKSIIDINTLNQQSWQNLK